VDPMQNRAAAGCRALREGGLLPATAERR
jgi:hypothetical protein